MMYGYYINFILVLYYYIFCDEMLYMNPWMGCLVLLWLCISMNKELNVTITISCTYDDYCSRYHYYIFESFYHIYVWKVVFLSLFYKLFFAFGCSHSMGTIPFHNQDKEGATNIMNLWWSDGFTTKIGKYQIFLFLYFLFHYICKRGHLLTLNFGLP